MKTKNIYLFFMFMILLWGCKFEESVNDNLTEVDAPESSALLQGLYESLRMPYQDQSRFWAAQQHTSDETIGPTRGPDWDDNGVWRVLHNHQWDADHSFLGNTYSELSRIIFNATDLLRDNIGATAAEKAQARFLRAFAMFSLVDGWGQVAYREDVEDFTQSITVLSTAEAMDFIISEVGEIMDDLPEGDAHVANPDAAKVLLMKLYLNRGTFLNRQSPAFPTDDMTRVIDLATEIIGSNDYSLTTNYFDNFAPTNDQISNELIFTYRNEAGTPSGSGNSVRSRWFCTLHYNQNPSGWNGFATIADFYDKFDDPNDSRREATYEGMTNISGVKAGFLEGQQVDQNGANVEDRKGNLLNFTKEVAIQESGDNLEVTGVRVIKYPIDYNNGDDVDNDYVFYRYADVLLMQAEAILRLGGGDAQALTIVNSIRIVRGAEQLTSIDLDAILDERGFELYWEGHRRQDLIRFGKFLDAWNEKPASGSERLLFPIPTTELALVPNLDQNPGY